MHTYTYINTICPDVRAQSEPEMFMDDSITCENVVGWMIGEVIYGNECDGVPIKKFLESACNCLIMLS